MATSWVLNKTTFESNRGLPSEVEIQIVEEYDEQRSASGLTTSRVQTYFDLLTSDTRQCIARVNVSKYYRAGSGYAYFAQKLFLVTTLPDLDSNALIEYDLCSCSWGFAHALAFRRKVSSLIVVNKDYKQQICIAGGPCEIEWFDGKEAKPGALMLPEEMEGKRIDAMLVNERIFFFCNQKICQTSSTFDSIESFISLSSIEGPCWLPRVHDGFFYYQRPCPEANSVSILQLFLIDDEFVEYEHVKEYTMTFPESCLCELSLPATWMFTSTQLQIDTTLKFKDMSQCPQNHTLIIPFNEFVCPEALQSTTVDPVLQKTIDRT